MLKQLGTMMAVGALLVTLAACNGEADGTDDGASPSPSPSPGVITGDSTDGAPSDGDNDASGEDPGADGPENGVDVPGDEGAFASVEACLQGEWLMDNDSWVAAAAPMFAEGGATLQSLDGVATLTLNADGTSQTTYVNWTMTATVADAGVSATSVIERHGVDSGTWSVTGDVFELHETSSDAVVNTYIEMDDQRIQLGNVDGEVGAMEATDTFTHDCSAATLVLSHTEGDYLYTR